MDEDDSIGRRSSRRPHRVSTSNVDPPSLIDAETEDAKSNGDTLKQVVRELNYQANRRQLRGDMTSVIPDAVGSGNADVGDELDARSLPQDNRTPNGGSPISKGTASPRTGSPDSESVPKASMNPAIKGDLPVSRTGSAPPRLSRSPSLEPRKKTKRALCFQIKKKSELNGGNRNSTHRSKRRKDKSSKRSRKSKKKKSKPIPVSEAFLKPSLRPPKLLPRRDPSNMDEASIGKAPRTGPLAVSTPSTPQLSPFHEACHQRWKDVVIVLLVLANLVLSLVIRALLSPNSQVNRGG